MWYCCNCEKQFGCDPPRCPDCQQKQDDALRKIREVVNGRFTFGGMIMRIRKILQENT
jgi:hypothetical protein